MMKRIGPSCLGVLALIVSACGGQSASEAAAPPARRVEVTAPREGETVRGPTVMVRLAAHGFTVVRAGDTTPNSGHHHIFLDRDVSPAGAPIPAEAGYIIHMGNGADSLALTVAPGQHRLIAVVGDAGHVPVPGLADTVRFVVR